MNDFLFVTVIVFWLWVAMSLGLIIGLKSNVDDIIKYIQRDFE